MDTGNWLARCAAFIDRLRGRAPERSAHLDRLAAKRSLLTRLPPHLRKDIGADDG